MKKLKFISLALVAFFITIMPGCSSDNNIENEPEIPENPENPSDNNPDLYGTFKRTPLKSEKTKQILYMYISIP